MRTVRVRSRNSDSAESGVSRATCCCMHVQLHVYMARCQLHMQLVGVDMNAVGGWDAGEAIPGHIIQNQQTYM